MPHCTKNLVGLAFLAGSMACSTGDADARRTVPVYDLYSGRLIRVGADQNRDGQLDQWTYLDGNFPLRGEADSDGDGRIDRWEYFNRDAQLTIVGSSSRNDGIEDIWTHVTAIDGLKRVDVSHRRDRCVDRREFYRDSALERVTEDTDCDGRDDKWERYELSVLRQAEFDTSFAAGKPDRRLLFDAAGRFVAVEADAERDGSFVRLTGAAADAAKAGVLR